MKLEYYWLKYLTQVTCIAPSAIDETYPAYGRFVTANYGRNVSYNFHETGTVFANI